MARRQRRLPCDFARHGLPTLPREVSQPRPVAPPRAVLLARRAVHAREQLRAALPSYHPRGGRCSSRVCSRLQPGSVLASTVRASTWRSRSAASRSNSAATCRNRALSTWAESALAQWRARSASARFWSASFRISSTVDMTQPSRQLRTRTALQQRRRYDRGDSHMRIVFRGRHCPWRGRDIFMSTSRCLARQTGRPRQRAAASGYERAPPPPPPACRRRGEGSDWPQPRIARAAQIRMQAPMKPAMR